MALELQIKNTEKITVTLSPVDADGNPATVDGAPVWTKTSTGGGTVEAAADGLSAVITSGDDAEVVTVDVTADVDKGTGVKELTDTISVTVSVPEATSLGLTASSPEPK